MVPPSSDRISRVPPYSRIAQDRTRTGLSPTLARLSRRFRLISRNHWPGPRSLATTSGVSVDVLSSGYLDVSVRRVRLASLWIQPAMTHKGRVSPFGDPRINGRSPLPAAYRSVLRPSSPLSAKASTKCPLTLDPTANPTRRDKPRAKPGSRPQRQAAIGHSALRHTTTAGQVGTQGDPPRRRKDRLRPHNLSTMSNNPDDDRRTSLPGKPPPKPCLLPRTPARSTPGWVEPNGIEPPADRRSANSKRIGSPHRLTRLVELNGIEPMTSCLQSRRSPN